MTTQRCTKKLENRDIVTKIVKKGLHAPAAAAKLLGVLNRYSARKHAD